MADPHEPETPQDPLVGKTLGGRYLVRALIDRGGMGKVYKAEQQPLGRMVALKTLDLMDPRGEFQQRFFNEAQTASRLTHPNTVRIFDYGRSDEGVYFLTMELLEGQSLHNIIKRSAPLDPLRVIGIMRQVCGALHEAHEQGIVHRDLKPGNIFLTRHGDDLEFAKVLDFGLVKNLESDVHLSQTGQSLGSPLYMAPEQVEGDKVDRRSDIYSLGLVMYVALTGKVPFKKGSVATIMMQQVTGTIPTFAAIAPDVSIHPSIEWVVRRCIEKKREDRIASMRELSMALKLCARELRSELSMSIPWNLDDSGHLDLPDDLLGQGEETAVGGDRAPAAPSTAPLEINDIPSSPTLNRSSASLAGAAIAGGGLLFFGMIAALVVLIVLFVGGVGWYYATPAPPPPVPVVVQPRPVPPPPPEPVAPVQKAVQLDSDPSGAEVLKGGAFVGTTPLSVDVTDGAVTLTVQAKGYAPREVLLDGTVAELKVPLEKKVGAVAPVQPVAQPAEPKPLSEVRDPWEE
ncbi:MAG: serine/threonine protein kinase [Alphaproteobacteria bacterium]|nr:serine/threonine protein kinase [Alphaproteobacteria bacterium]